MAQDDFITDRKGELQWFSPRSSLPFGLCGGFFGCELGASTTEMAVARFKEELNVNLFVAKQVHGDQVLEVSSIPSGERPCADALIAPLPLTAGFGIGVVTADCVPVLLISSSHIAVIHAGWRGLASGIIAKTIKKIGKPLRCLIGPAAGATRYEVEQDVIDALGRHAVFQPAGPKKFLLDLVAIAKQQVMSASRSSLPITILQRCTITDEQFHSYRRQGKGAGRNVAALWRRPDV